MEPELVTVTNFTKLYGLGKTKTYELINDGTIEVVKVGRRTLIKNKSARARLLGEAA